MAVGRSIGEDSQEVPVAVRAMRLSSAAPEQPDFFGGEHLDDPLDDPRWNRYRDHAGRVARSASRDNHGVTAATPGSASRVRALRFSAGRGGLFSSAPKPRPW